MHSTATFGMRVFGKSARFLLLAGSILAGLSSCTVGKFPLTPEAAAREAKPGGGFIAASFTEKGFSRSNGKLDGSWCVSLHVKDTRGTAVTLLPWVMPVNRDPKLAGGGYASKVVAVPVPAGTYEIIGVTIKESPQAAPVLFIARRRMNVPFDVRSGETTYLGRISAVAHYKNGVADTGLGPRVPDGMSVTLTDEFGTDAPRVAEMYPSIPRSSVSRSDASIRFQAEMDRLASPAPGLSGLF